MKSAALLFIWFATVLLGIPLGSHASAQLKVTPQETNGNMARLLELVQELDQTSLPNASIRIEGIERFSDGDRSEYFDVFSGFRLHQLDGCTLRLKNEGLPANKSKPFLAEATIPLADLQDREGDISQRAAYNNPRLSEQYYGRWVVKFRSRKSKRLIRLETKLPSQIFAYGSVLVFGFGDRASAKTFAQNFRNLIHLCNEK